MILRLLSLLIALGNYETLTRARIQDVCGEKNDRVMRKFLAQLVALGLIAKTRMEVVSSLGAGAPVYYLTTKGAEYLAAEVDPKYLHCTTTTPQWTTLIHTVQVEELHIALDRAIALQSMVGLGGWMNERRVVNPHETQPEKRYSLFTLLREKPRLVCNPDAAFLLKVGTYAKSYYVELDRASSSIQQITNSKPPGFAELLKQQAHKRHLPTNMDTFSVLSVSPTPGRRDLLRSAMKSKVGADLWKFCTWNDFVAPERLLFEAIWFPCEGEPSPLVKRK
jgi:Replication-relaxation